MKEEKIKLDFHGPFKYKDGTDSLFLSEFAKQEGIYIWTIKDVIHGINYVHYIGETNTFAKRQRDHLIQITGQNYRIIDAEYARQGVEKIIWNGFWRDRSLNAAQKLMDNYVETSKKVVEYIELVNIYFAPTTMDTDTRRYIEGCLGWNIREFHPDLKVFFPDDNILRKPKNKRGIQLTITLPEDIAGIDTELSL